MEEFKRECDVVNADGSLLVSIIIDNYNYGRFLPEAIDSALRQTYAYAEVVVVDDGSTDSSRDVIASYGDRVRAVFKENGGQASAFNAGFAASRGDVVMFLDSDDVFYADAVARVVALFAPGVSKVHGALEVVDAAGIPTGKTKPGVPLPEGDLRHIVLEKGPSNCASPPTSGNAWARWFLERVMPAPEEVTYYRTCADEYLYTLAPAFGEIRTVVAPLGAYRIHGENIYSGRSFHENMRLELDGYDQQCGALAAVLRRAGIEGNTAHWRSHSWFHRLEAALAEIDRIVPQGQEFILVDDDTWGRDQIFEPDRARPFLERNGTSWGAPPDDKTAIDELERMRAEGSLFLVLAWPAFWWLEFYRPFFDYIRAHYSLVRQDERLVVFDLCRKLTAKEPRQ